MPPDIQRLRCKVNFEALVFVPHIRELGETIVRRLRGPIINEVASNGRMLEGVRKPGNEQTGKFIVLHLRFDKVWSLFVLTECWNVKLIYICIFGEIIYH